MNNSVYDRKKGEGVSIERGDPCGLVSESTGRERRGWLSEQRIVIPSIQKLRENKGSGRYHYLISRYEMIAKEDTKSVWFGLINRNLG